MFDKESSIPRYLQIQNLLEEGIRSGVYPPGSQVPSELQIAEQYSISRMTARKALDALVSRGILYRRKGKGTYVAENRLSYGLSTMLSFSQTLRARGIDVVTKVLRIEVIPAPSDVQQNLELGAGAQVIIIGRLRYAEGKPVAIHTSYLPYPQYAALLDIDLSQHSLLDSIKKISGVSVAYTRDSVQADLASPEEAHLLALPPHSPVLKVEGVAYSEYGAHTRYSKAVYRGDVFTLLVTNTGEETTALRFATEDKR